MKKWNIKELLVSIPKLKHILHNSRKDNRWAIFKHVSIIKKFSIHGFNAHANVSECASVSECARIDTELSKQKTWFYQGTAHGEEKPIRIRLLDAMLPFTLLVSRRQDTVPNPMVLDLFINSRGHTANPMLHAFCWQRGRLVCQQTQHQ